MMSIEITVTLKDEEGRRLTRDYLIYENVTLIAQDPMEDPAINSCVKSLLDEFKGIPDDIKVKALMVLR
jgi:hypothetical protein